jgi:hypothetical protein
MEKLNVGIIGDGRAAKAHIEVNNGSRQALVDAVYTRCLRAIVLTYSSEDDMEDPMNASRLAVTAAFAHGIPNFQTEPHQCSFPRDVTLYHAMPYGLNDPLRQRVRAGLYGDTAAVHERKRSALSAHHSQRHCLGVSLGMDSYLASMDAVSRLVGRLSERFEHPECWRRHLHLGTSSKDLDPLSAALEKDYSRDALYEEALLFARSIHSRNAQA